MSGMNPAIRTQLIRHCEASGPSTRCYPGNTLLNLHSVSFQEYKKQLLKYFCFALNARRVEK